MKKIRLTEKDLQRIVKRVLTEQSHYDRDEMGNIIDDEGRIIKVMSLEEKIKLIVKIGIINKMYLIILLI